MRFRGLGSVKTFLEWSDRCYSERTDTCFDVVARDASWGQVAGMAVIAASQPPYGAPMPCTAGSSSILSSRGIRATGTLATRLIFPSFAGAPARQESDPRDKGYFRSVYGGHQRDGHPRDKTQFPRLRRGTRATSPVSCGLTARQRCYGLI